MDRLLIRGEPTSPFQYLYIFQNNQMISSFGIEFENLVEVVFDVLLKYNISAIDLSGVHSYLEGIKEQINTANITHYNLKEITFRYV